MKMRFEIKAIAAAVALCGAGPSAHALDPTVTPIDCAGATACIYMSGSSAVDNVVANTIARGVAAGGAGNNTCDQWLDGKLGSTTQTTELIYCSLNAGTFFSTNLGAGKTSIAVWKFSAGGSANGVTPVYTSTPLNFQLTYTSCAAPVAKCGTVLNEAFTSHTCAPSGAVTPTVPYIGVSDEEPRVFGFGTSAPAGFRFDAFNQVVFGIAASKYARDSLQKAQLCAPGTVGNLPATCAVGDDTDECQPSISHAAVSGIMQGKITRWDSMSNACGAAFSQTIPAAGGAANPSQTIFFARRSNGSGTQRISNINFTSQGECTNVLNFAPTPLAGTPSATPASCSGAAPNPVSPTGAGRIFQMNSSEDLVECTDDFNTLNFGSIAILSTEYQPAVGGLPSGFRFLKLDGNAPSLVNAAKGRYIYVSEPTMQSKDTATNPYADPVVAPFRDALLAALASTANSVDSNTCNNTGSPEPWWGGTLIPQTAASTPPAANPITEAAIHATPVSTQTKQGNTTGKPSNCYPTTGFPTGLYAN